MAKEQPNRQPTARQIKAAKLISENIRADKPKAVGTLLQEAGYSKEVSERPSQVVQSTGFQRVLEEAGVTDDKLSKVLDEGLSATTKDGAPDYSVRHKYLETGVKLKGHVSGTPDAPPPVNTTTFNIIGSETVEQFTEFIMSKSRLDTESTVVKAE